MFIQITDQTNTEEFTILNGVIELSDEDIGHFHVALDATFEDPAQIVISIQGYDEREGYTIEFMAELDRGLPKLEQAQTVRFTPGSNAVAVDFVDDGVAQMALAVSELPIVSHYLDERFAKQVGYKSITIH